MAWSKAINILARQYVIKGRNKDWWPFHQHVLFIIIAFRNTFHLSWGMPKMSIAQYLFWLFVWWDAFHDWVSPLTRVLLSSLIVIPLVIPSCVIPHTNCMIDFLLRTSRRPIYEISALLPHSAHTILHDFIPLKFLLKHLYYIMSRYCSTSTT